MASKIIPKTLPSAPEISSKLAQEKIWLSSYERLIEKEFSKYKSFAFKTDFEPEGQVYSVAISQDCSLIAGGLGNGLIILWNSISKNQVCRLAQHESRVTSLAITTNNRYILSASFDKTVKIWSIAECRELHVIREFSDDVNCVVLSYDEKHFAIASSDNLVYLYAFETYEKNFTFEGHDGQVKSVSFSPNGDFLASGSWDCTVKIWNLRSKAEHYTFEGHSGGISVVAYCPDNDCVISAATDYLIKVWSTKSLEELYCLNGHKDEIIGLTVSFSGKLAASIDENSFIIVWNLEIKKKEVVLKQKGKMVNSIAFSQNDNFFITGSDEKEIVLWNLYEQRCENTLTEHKSHVTSLKITNDNNYLISGSRDCEIIIWDLKNMKDTHLIGHQNCVVSLSVSSNSETLASGSDDGFVNLWSISDKILLYSEQAHDSSINSLSFNQSSNILLCGLDNGILKAYNTNGLKLEYSLEAHNLNISSIVITSNDGFFFTGSWDKSIKCWNFREKKCEFTLLGHKEYVTSLALTTDNNYVISGSEDNTVKVWNVREQSEFFTLHGHLDFVNTVSVSKDGAFIASGSRDNIVKVWNFKDRREEFMLEGHIDEIDTVVFSNDGSFLASGGKDESIKIWNTRKFKEEVSFDKHEQIISGLGASQDGEYVVSACWNSIIFTSLKDNSQEVLEVDEILCLEVSPDCSLIAAGSDKGEVKIWDFKVRKPLYKLETDCDTVHSLAFNHKSNILAIATYKLFIKLYDLNLKKEICSFQGHTYNIYSLSFSPLDDFIVSGSYDRTVRLWKLSDNSQSHIIPEDSKVTEVIYSYSGSFIAYCLESGNLKIWNVCEQRDDIVFSIPNTSIDCIALSRDERFIISGSSDGIIRVWNIVEKREEGRFIAHTDKIMRVYICYTGDLILSGGMDKKVNFWNMKNRNKKDRNWMIYNSIKENNDDSAKISILNDTIDHCSENKPNEKTQTLISIVDAMSNSMNVVFGDSNDNLVFGTEKAQEYTISLGLNSEIPIVKNSKTQETVQVYNALQLYWKTEDQRFGVFCENFASKFIIDFSDKKFIQLSSCFFQTNLYDNNLENRIIFYNAVDSIKKIDFSNLSYEAALIPIGQFQYTLLHYFCVNGLENELEKFTRSDSFYIRADIFNRSPFYYCIIKGFQKCTEILLESLIILSEKSQDLRYQNSLYAIRSDFVMIIENSSKNLPQFLRGILIRSSTILAKITKSIPILQDSCSSYFEISMFISKDENPNSVAIPVTLWATPFPIISELGSQENISLLKALISSNNVQIFREKAIQFYIQYQWKHLKIHLFLYTLVLFLNILFVMLLMCLDEWYTGLMIPLLFIIGSLFIFEVMKMSGDIKDYLYEYWGYIDMAKFAVTLAWIIMESQGYKDLYLRWFVGLLTFIRGITGFRILDGTRFYIDLIIQSLGSIKYFLLVFFYTTLGFGFLFTISRSEKSSFDSLWLESFDLNFGYYHADLPGGTDFSFNYAVFFISSIINVILMLNLLISILGDSYDRFQLEQACIDYKEKAKTVLEFQKLMYWRRAYKGKKYIHACTHSYEDDSSESWEGRIIFMDKKWDSTSKDIKETFSSIESKLATIEERIENRMTFMEVKIDNKMHEVDSKVSDLSKEMQELNRKFDIILQRIK